MRRKPNFQLKHALDRKTVTEVLEYAAVVILALLAAWVISGTLATDLWGGLSGHNLPF